VPHPHLVEPEAAQGTLGPVDPAQDRHRHRRAVAWL